MVQFQINLWRNTITNAVLKVDTKDNAIVYSFVVDDSKQTNTIASQHITGKSTKILWIIQLQLKMQRIKRYLIAGNIKSYQSNDINLNQIICY
jgi:hypothetical protein